MPCASYANPKLAAVYDPLNPPGAELRFYEELAGAEPLRILDVGSGTGRFASRLAALGYDVTVVAPPELPTGKPAPRSSPWPVDDHDCDRALSFGRVPAMPRLTQRGTGRQVCSTQKCAGRELVIDRLGPAEATMCRRPYPRLTGGSLISRISFSRMATAKSS
jgi:hypothetical protein